VEWLQGWAVEPSYSTVLEEITVPYQAPCERNGKVCGALC
jgi:hypothetical protein